MNQYDKSSRKSEVMNKLVELISRMSLNEQLSLLNKLKEYQLGKSKYKTRKYERTKSVVSVDYQIDDSPLKDDIRDISPSGVFMESDETFDIGQEIILAINFSEEGNPFRIPAEVIRSTSEGVGLKFKFKSQVQEAIITSLIENLKKSRD